MCYTGKCPYEDFMGGCTIPDAVDIAKLPSAGCNAPNDFDTERDEDMKYLPLICAAIAASILFGGIFFICYADAKNKEAAKKGV